MLTPLPRSFADCFERWAPQPPGTLWACSRPCRDCFTSYRKALGPNRRSPRQTLGLSNQVENLKQRNRLENLGIENNIKMERK